MLDIDANLEFVGKTGAVSVTGVGGKYAVRLENWQTLRELSRLRKVLPSDVSKRLQLVTLNAEVFVGQRQVARVGSGEDSWLGSVFLGSADIRPRPINLLLAVISSRKRI